VLLTGFTTDPSEVWQRARSKIEKSLCKNFVGLVCCVVVALAENDYWKNSPQRAQSYTERKQNLCVNFVSFVCSMVVALTENDRCKKLTTEDT